MIKLVIVDDNSQIRNTLNTLLKQYEDCEILFTANNGIDFLEKMREYRKNIMPDIVLMDLDMPVMNGIDAIKEGKLRYPNLKFLVLTIFDEDEKIFNAIKSGADGYLLKDEPIDKIKESIDNLMNNICAPMSPSIARKVFNLLSANSEKIKQLNTEKLPKNLDDYQLSDREKEILLLLINGLEYKEIAEKLNISPNTVRNCVSKIYKKLHVNSSIQAAKLFRNNNN